MSGPTSTTRSVTTYRFGFSPTGLVAFLLAMVPNVYWVLHGPVPSALPPNRSALPFVDVAATVCQVVMVALLVLLINTRRRPTTGRQVLAAVGVGCLVGYLLSWGLYFTQPITPALLVTMAILPSVYFICVGLYLDNYPSLVAAVPFGLLHVTTTAIIYL